MLYAYLIKQNEIVDIKKIYKKLITLKSVGILRYKKKKRIETYILNGESELLNLKTGALAGLI